MSDEEARREAAAADLAAAGLTDAPIEIVDYDPDWPVRFEAERARLEPLLGGAEVHHIGSTAVPGLAAKDVVDLLAQVDDLDAPIERLRSTGGYQFPEAYNRTLTGRRFLCHPSLARREHHLHLVDSAEEFARRVEFRDRLRADRDLARRYGDLKRELAARYRDDRERYTDAKADFITGRLQSGNRSSRIE